MKPTHTPTQFHTSAQTGQAGFTLGEVVIVIAVVAILAAMITPLAVSQITQKRFDFCREELQNIKIAIVGNPELLEGGSRTSFGFVGDVGILPRVLGELIDPTLGAPDIPLSTTTGHLTWGWRGPYIAELIDPWGRDYRYALFGTGQIAARIWSIGPDNTDGSADDLSLDIRRDEAFSWISGNTTDACGVPVGSDLTITYPTLDPGDNQFKLAVFTTTTTQTDPIYHSNVAMPIGIRHVTYDLYERLIFINNGPDTIVNLKTPIPCN
jgi:general secretion pathway protein G